MILVLLRYTHLEKFLLGNSLRCSGLQRLRIVLAQDKVSNKTLAGMYLSNE